MISTLMLIVIEALVIFSAIGVGMRWHAHLNRVPKPVSTPEPNLTCGCQHVLAYHDPKTGICNQLTATGHYENRPRSKNSSFSDRLWVQDEVTCKCQQYTGELTMDWYARSLPRGEE